MEVMLVIGLATICDKSDMENLSMKRFDDFESLDKHLASIKKGEGKFEVISLDGFVSDWNDTDEDADYMKSYRRDETFMGYTIIG